MRASWSRLTPFGVASRPPGGIEGWTVELAASVAENFDLGPEHVALAREAASWPQGLAAGETRTLLLLVLASLIAQSRGSTRLPLEGDTLREILEALVPGDGEFEAITALLASERVSSIVGLRGERKPFVIDRNCLYSEHLYRAEEGLAGSLADRIRRKPEPVFEAAAIDAALAAVRANPSVVGGKTVLLSSEQEGAVTKAVGLPLSVVSGGPGTGKTSIVVSILRVLVRLGLEPHAIALAAPTGKAAQRMSEAVSRALRSIPALDPRERALLEHGPEPVTIHRLLGASLDGSRVRHHAGNRLEQRVAIVDEASMIDMHLMDRLVRAVRPEARLVLLGDVRQLPSVGAGAVLRDLIAEGAHPLAAHGVKLTKNYRVASGAALLDLARRISPEGEPATGSVGDALALRATPEALVFDKAESLAAESPAALRRFLEHWYATRIASLPGFEGLVARAYRTREGSFEPDAASALGALFAHFEGSRILCLTHVYRTGTEVVNAALRAIHVERTGGKARSELAAGEPVLVLANDYEKKLWNGDQGLVLRVGEVGGKLHLAAVFRRGDGFTAVPLELLRGRLDRAFALTVHKAQGSEFDHVALILPDRDVPLLTKEILYTGVTRSRKSVVVVGKSELLALGASRVLERSSGVGERLGEGLG